MMDMFLLRQSQCCVATKKLAGCLTSLRDSQHLSRGGGVLFKHVYQEHAFILLHQQGVAKRCHRNCENITHTTKYS